MAKFFDTLRKRRSLAMAPSVEMAVFARDARDEAGGRWEPVLETDDDSEFKQFYERIRGMEGLRGLGTPSGPFGPRTVSMRTQAVRLRRAEEAHMDGDDATAEQIMLDYFEEPGSREDPRALALWKRVQKGLEGGSLRGLSSSRKLRRGSRPGMTEVTELELYAENTEPLYRMKLLIEKNLMGKLARGQYNRKKAEKAFKHYADRAAQGYTHEFGGSGRSSFGVFSTKEREALAKREERQFFARVKSRDQELLSMVPKKYRKSGQTCEVRRTNGTFKLDCNIDLRGMSRRRRRR